MKFITKGSELRKSWLYPSYNSIILSIFIWYVYEKLSLIEELTCSYIVFKQKSLDLYSNVDKVLTNIRGDPKKQGLAYFVLHFLQFFLNDCQFYPKYRKLFIFRRFLKSIELIYPQFKFVRGFLGLISKFLRQNFIKNASAYKCSWCTFVVSQIFF